MIKYILLLVLLNTIILNANENIKIKIQALCSEKEKFSINLSSNRLNLTEDAVQDNTGGYVDIPEENLFLKTADKLYRLNGVVESNYKDNTNQFIAYINQDSTKFITTEELYNLKDTKELKLIQKIVLDNEVNSVKRETTTNILQVYFDENSFDKEHQKCKLLDVKNSKKNSYFYYLMLVFFVLLVLYVIKKRS